VCNGPEVRLDVQTPRAHLRAGQRQQGTTGEVVFAGVGWRPRGSHCCLGEGGLAEVDEEGSKF
jgi:hypothetical protein